MHFKKNDENINIYGEIIIFDVMNLANEYIASE